MACMSFTELRRPTCPGGTVTYLNILGATRPTIADGSVAPGSFYSSGDGFTPGLAIDFGRSKVGVLMIAEIGGIDQRIESPGGHADPRLSTINLTRGGRFTSGTANVPVEVEIFDGPPFSPACPTGPCLAKVEGFLAGLRGHHAGVLYQFGQSSLPNKRVTGGVVFGAGD
jgi:hypothetical protein